MSVEQFKRFGRAAAYVLNELDIAKADTYTLVQARNGAYILETRDKIATIVENWEDYAKPVYAVMTDITHKVAQISFDSATRRHANVVSAIDTIIEMSGKDATLNLSKGTDRATASLIWSLCLQHSTTTCTRRRLSELPGENRPMYAISVALGEAVVGYVLSVRDERGIVTEAYSLCCREEK